MKKFTKEITALLTTIALGAAAGLGVTASAMEEMPDVAGEALPPATTTRMTTTTIAGATVTARTTTTTVVGTNINPRVTTTLPPIDGGVMPPIEGTMTAPRTTTMTTTMPPIEGTMTAPRTTIMTTTLPPIEGTMTAPRTTTTMPPIAGGIEGPMFGDVNGDGVVGIGDVVTLQRYLLKQNKKLVDSYNADMNHDGQVNVFDLTMLKQSFFTLHDDQPPVENNDEFYTAKGVEMIGYVEINDEPSAVITSREELQAFLEPYMPDGQTLGSYMSAYDDAFFENNVLLMKFIFQSCGTEPMYEIGKVYYENDTLVINYNDIYVESAGCDVVSELLATVVMPKENCQVESVVWNYTNRPTPVVDDQPCC